MKNKNNKTPLTSIQTQGKSTDFPFLASSELLSATYFWESSTYGGKFPIKTHCKTFVTFNSEPDILTTSALEPPFAIFASSFHLHFTHESNQNCFALSSNDIKTNSTEFFSQKSFDKIDNSLIAIWTLPAFTSSQQHTSNRFEHEPDFCSQINVFLLQKIST